MTIRAGLATKNDSRTSVFWPFDVKDAPVREERTESDDGADGDEAGEDSEHDPLSLSVALSEGSIITGRPVRDRPVSSAPTVRLE